MHGLKSGDKVQIGGHWYTYTPGAKGEEGMLHGIRPRTDPVADGWSSMQIEYFTVSADGEVRRSGTLLGVIRNGRFEPREEPRR